MTDNIKVAIRVPNLPLGPIVDKDGNPTQNEQLFRQALIDLLQLYLSPEGMVMPAQSPTNVTTIAANLDGITGQATCLPGTVIYQQHPSDYTQDSLVVAFRNSNTTGVAPVIKTVTVT